MSDLESRLHADAAHDAELTPPPFEGALRTASTARRVPSWVAPAAAAATVVAVGVGILAAADDGSHVPAGGDGVSASSSFSLEPGYRIVHVGDVGFRGAIIDEDDPNILHVVVPTGSQHGQCSATDLTATAVARGSTVTVRVIGSEIWATGTTPSGNADTGCATESNGRQVSVRLDAPLGSRTLIDSATGKPQYVLDPSTVPAPSYLPTGLREEGVDLVVWHGDALASRRYLTHVLNGPGLQLVITVGPKSQVFLPLAKDAKPVHVGVHDALYRTDPQCVLWVESPGHAVQMCATTVGLSEGAPTPPMTKAELLKIARSLP